MRTGAGVAGFGAALVIPRLAVKAGLPSKWTQGWAGVAASAISAIVAGKAASALGFRKAAGPIIAGGLIAAGVKAALRLIPAAQVDKVLPIGDLRGGPALPAPSTGVSGYLTPGSAARYLASRNNVSGVGSYLTPASAAAYVQGGYSGGNGFSRASVAREFGNYDHMSERF